MSDNITTPAVRRGISETTHKQTLCVIALNRYPYKGREVSSPLSAVYFLLVPFLLAVIAFIIHLCVFGISFIIPISAQTHIQQSLLQENVSFRGRQSAGAAVSQNASSNLLSCL